MAELRIGEAAKVLGVTPKALRFYERRGFLPPPPRTGGRYRLYSPQDLERARFLMRAKALGLELEEAAEVLACAEAACCGETGPRLEATLRSRLAQVEAQMRELRMLRRKLKEALASIEPPSPVAAARPAARRRSAWPRRSEDDGAGST